MRKQRSGLRSRRGFLRAAGAGAIGGLAGCSVVLADLGGRSGATEPVSILAAGSLQLALSEGLASAVDVPVRTEVHGSTTVVRLVAGGRRDPDIVSVADTALFDTVLQPDWYATFASNALVVAYNPDTAGGARIEAAGPDAWYVPIVAGAASLGRADPAVDPLGYRTLFMLDLAERYYAEQGLRDRVLAPDQRYPETSLVSRLETGAIDAAVVYRNMAVERDYAYLDLPAEIDLSSPAHEDEWYSQASYELGDDATVRGGLISYGSTVRRTRSSVLDVFDAHVTGEYLTDHGFVVPETFPRYEGHGPDAVA